MADEATGFLTESQAASEIGKIFADESAPETREVKFKAKVKTKAPQAAPPVEAAVIPMEPADGSPDPDRELDEDSRPEVAAKVEQDGGGEGEQKESVPDEGDEDQEPARTLRIKVDGLEQDVPEDEVIKGYSRQADYTRKTQAHAETVKRFEADVAGPLRQERQEYITALDALASFLPVQGREPDWTRLADELPDADFKQQFAQYHEGQKRWKQMQEQRNTVTQRAIADEQRALQVRVAEEMEKLKVALPDFGDSVKAKEKQADLVAYAKSLSFTDDDLATITDHRLLVLLEHSRLWSEQQRRRPKIEDKIDRALDAIRPTATKSKPRASEVERLHGSLKKSGSVDDAAALITRMGLT